MKYSAEEVIQFTQEEDVKFIRLAFCDVFGKQKNISIMPGELPRAFEQGIVFDPSAIAGFGDVTRNDLLLHPDPETLMPLPWRPEHGRVVQMFCGITYPDGTPFECDTRSLLKKAVADAEEAGIRFAFGAEQEFYLFLLDENGKPTMIPCDRAGYMDIAPEDHGENVRREICLTLEKMGIHPESSHHEKGPGQNEIDFRYSDPLTAADNAMTFQRVVRTVAHRNGLAADFSPKPLVDEPGNGFHIHMSLESGNDSERLSRMIAGLLANIRSMTAFLNPTEGSYRRLGNCHAPSRISWSCGNRSQLIRIPAAAAGHQRAELRSADPCANPYLAFALMIYAGLSGIREKLSLPEPEDAERRGSDALQHSARDLSGREDLPKTYEQACRAAQESEFIRAHIPSELLSAYCGSGT